MNLVDACALKSGENSRTEDLIQGSDEPCRRLCVKVRRKLKSFGRGPSSRPTPPAPERGVPGDGPRPCKERPERGSEETEWRRRHISRTASAFLGVGDEIHTLMSTGPRPRVDMMPRNDTWRGRDAHQVYRIAERPGLACNALPGIGTSDPLDPAS